MKLTSEQRKGIEERFLVLAMHVNADFINHLFATPEDRATVRGKTAKDIEACRDEVLLLVERLEPKLPLPAAPDEAPAFGWHRGLGRTEPGEGDETKE